MHYKKDQTFLNNPLNYKMKKNDLKNKVSRLRLFLDAIYFDSSSSDIFRELHTSSLLDLIFLQQITFKL